MAMLLQMKKIVREEQPDVFLLSGDVYHTGQPSAAVQTMLTEAIVDLHQEKKDMVIVMTAGNHDSGTKHEIFRTPWKALNVYAIGQLEGDDMDSHIIEVKGKGYIVAVPYVNERNIPEGFFLSLLDRVKERNDEELPVVMMAHTTIKGCDFMGHDHANEMTVGGIDAIELDEFGEGYDYLALGHIHKEQFVRNGKHHVRYCGSPLAVSFDETGEHSVSMVEIGRHGEQPEVKKIVIENPRPLVTIPEQGFKEWDEVIKLLQEYPDDVPAYIRLNVQVDVFLPFEAQEEAYKATKEKRCRFCCINTRRKVEQHTKERVMSVQEFQEENPLNIAQRYADDIGQDFDDELKELFNEVVRMVQNDERKN